jgi:hypothetical protein
MFVEELAPDLPHVVRMLIWADFNREFSRLASNSRRRHYVERGRGPEVFFIFSVLFACCHKAIPVFVRI